MVYLERSLFAAVLLLPLLSPSEAIAWMFLLIGAITGMVAIVSQRWVLWPLVGIVIVEAALLNASVLELSIAVAIFHVVIVVVAAVPLWLFPIPRWPSPQGPHAVGYREFDLSNEVSVERPGKAFAWYPAISTNTNGRLLQTRSESQALEDVQTYLGKHPRIQAHMRHAKTHVDAQADPAEGTFPLVVFNHGGALWPNQNFSLMEALSAAGYVVMSIGHPGESAGLVYAGGVVHSLSPELVGQLRGSESSMLAFAEYLTSATSADQAEHGETLASLQTGTQSGTERWARHTLATIDWVKDKGRSAGLTIDIDFNRIIYVGMSIGGSVAYRCCQLDDRAIGGVNLDGMIWDFEHLSCPLKSRFLMCYSDLVGLRKSVIEHLGWDRDPAVGIPFNNIFFRGAKDRVVSVEYPGSSHMNFTDFGWAACGWAKKQFGLGPVDPRVMIQSVNELVLAFANDCVGTSDSALEQCLKTRSDWRVVT